MTAPLECIDRSCHSWHSRISSYFPMVQWRERVAKRYSIQYPKNGPMSQSEKSDSTPTATRRTLLMSAFTASAEFGSRNMSRISTQTHAPGTSPSAQQIARSRRRGRYLLLRCGHYTDDETQQEYSAWRPKKRSLYCEVESKWTSIMPKPKKPKLPDEPMF
jgi:hypothetical protein